MKRTTRGWVRKAESDFRLAVTIARGTKPFHDEQCFHCQQSAEKYLKAIMEEHGLTIPKTHILVALVNLLAPHHNSLRSLRRGVDFLTRFAVDTRYPGDAANKRQAMSALRWASQVRDACRTILGIRPPRSRRRQSP
jgi:HEPN domain-containing protein